MIALLVLISCNNPEKPDPVVDTGCDSDLVTHYADADADGYGDDATATDACEVPSGRVEVGGDCDDASADVSPDAEEVCDGVDNNCDTEVDENKQADVPYEGDLSAGFEDFCVDYCFRSLEGSLDLSAATREEIDALSCLTTASGALTIEGNVALESAGLPALASLGGQLNIAHNDALASLELPALAALGGGATRSPSTMPWSAWSCPRSPPSKET